MKGVIFKHFEAFIAETFGAPTFEAILDRTKLQTIGPFVGPRTYPDEDLFALVGTAIELSGLPADDAIFAFGEFLYPRLAASVPELLARHTECKGLLMELDRVIHVEVRKLLPDAVTPRILCEDTGPGELLVNYRSPRKLCPLFRGLVTAAARSYDQTVVADERACMRDGHDACTLALRFSARGVAAA